MRPLDAIRLYSLGITAEKFNWGHVREAFTETKLCERHKVSEDVGCGRTTNAPGSSGKDCYLLMTVCVNAGAATTSVFGVSSFLTILEILRRFLPQADMARILQPIILQSLVGFTADQAVLLNMPFGFLQWVAILIASWLAQRYQNKSAILFAWNIPVIIGVALLYALPKTKSNQGPLLLGYCAYQSGLHSQRCSALADL